MAVIFCPPPSSIAVSIDRRSSDQRSSPFRRRFTPPRLASSSRSSRWLAPILSSPSLLRRRFTIPRLAVSCRYSPSESHEDPPPSSTGGDVHAGTPPSRRSGEGASVFVTVPANSVGQGGRISNRKAMSASLKALALAGVEGVVVEFWWGIVEGDAPGVYDWRGYTDLVSMAGHHGLKVRAIMAFHQYGSGPSDPCWIPLPDWVLKEMDKEPDLAYSDKFGRRSKEYISLGCDNLPLLKGRSSIQAYSDFMRSFRDTFKGFLGIVITEVQIGMGPAGELRYPSCPSEKLKQPSTAHELCVFQCYDKNMLASLRACTHDIGMHEWGYGGPLGASDSMQNPEEACFFRTDGSWNSHYGRFFLEWYSGLLLHHGERLCMVANSIFLHTGVKIFAKVARIYWHYYMCSHPSELAAGYYNTVTSDGYHPMARLFSKYKVSLCCTFFDMQDADEHNKSKSSPEDFLRKLVHAARMHNLSVSGENFGTRLDDRALEQVINISKLCSDGAYETSLSFNYVRMDRHLFNPHNWPRFTHFVRQMSHGRTFQAKLDFRRREQYFSSVSTAENFT
ncbi:hypothetical protein KSP39_PZI001484 [Platanthera zijinensis]|uniref:Beta-amylase n=1 Tax=Platanthera zijinensis TaxID=2320716 RepID=A0AAP0C3G2_9ASPA